MPDPIVSYSEQMTREEPYMEAMRRGLLQDVRGLQANRFGYNLVDTGQTDEFGYPIQRYEKIMDDAGQWVGPAYEPDYQVAELTPEQQQASAQAQQGLGAFMPYMQGGLRNIQQGQQYTQQARDLAALTREDPYKYQQQGQQYLQQARGLAGTTREDPYGYQQSAAQGLGTSIGQFTPGTLADPASQISAYYNPYEQQVVDVVKSDFDRARKMSDMQEAGKAVGAGAFGGSRSGIAQQEAQRNLNDAELKALASIRGQGYQGAMTQASTDFENQQRRAQQAAQMMGSLGSTYGQLGQRDVELLSNLGQGMGNLGSTYGQLGQRDVELLSNLGKGLGSLGTSEANLGSLAAGQARGDVSMLSNLGAIRRGVDQDVLDAVYKTNLARQRMPYQEYSYYGDMLSGIPSQQQTLTTKSQPGATAGQTALGYGLAGLGALAGFNQLAPA
jgi:hypothetical protein